MLHAPRFLTIGCVGHVEQKIKPGPISYYMLANNKFMKMPLSQNSHNM